MFADKNNGSLLQQSDGEIFISLFRCLRLSYVLNDAVSVKIVEQDNIIPRGNGNLLNTCTVHYIILCYSILY